MFKVTAEHLDSYAEQVRANLERVRPILDADAPELHAAADFCRTTDRGEAERLDAHLSAGSQLRRRTENARVL